MSGVVVPFTPARRAEPAGPPPMLVSWNRLAAAFVGTREQLMAWNLIRDDQFPEERERRADHGRVSVLALRHGLYRLNRYDLHHDRPESQRIHELCRRIVGGDCLVAKASRVMVDSRRWSMELGTEVGFAEGEAVEEAVNELELAAAEILRRHVLSHRA